jgi:hypothetical protein
MTMEFNSNDFPEIRFKCHDIASCLIKDELYEITNAVEEINRLYNMLFEITRDIAIIHFVDRF